MSKFSLEQIESRLKSMITEVAGYEEKLLTRETKLTPDEHSDKALSVGSLELAELLITIDEEFNVNIPDEVAVTLNTIGSLADYIVVHIQ